MDSLKLGDKLVFIFAGIDMTRTHLTREKDIEKNILSRLKIPYFDDLNSLTTEREINIIKSLDGKIILMRGSMPITPALKDAIKCARIKYKLDIKFLFEDILPEKILNWYKYVGIEWTKRVLSCVDLHDWEQSLRYDEKGGKKPNNYIKMEYPHFIKPLGILEPYVAHSKFHAIITNPRDLYGPYAYSFMNLLEMRDKYQMLISNILNITKDEIDDGYENLNKVTKHNREWRGYVVNGKLTSLSRYVDYNSLFDIPEELIKFANKFVESNQELPITYVADFMEFINTKNEIDYALVEINHVEYSGRYELNNFDSFVYNLCQMDLYSLNIVETLAIRDMEKFRQSLKASSIPYPENNSGFTRLIEQSQQTLKSIIKKENVNETEG